MKRSVPTAPLILGLAGVLPFLWAAATHHSPGLAAATGGVLPPLFMGKYAGIAYGSMILSFMSGVLWGFATRREGPGAAIWYALSVLPALWVVFAVQDATDMSILNLGAGFLAVLALDVRFARKGLTPPWWITLRLPLTGIVVLCLASLLYG